MYQRYCDLRDRKGYKDADVARILNITPSTFSDWKKGKSVPNTDKLIKIANLLETSVEYLFSGASASAPEESTSGKKYYFSDETARIAQELHEKPHLRALMDAERDLTPEAAQALIALINTQLKKEGGDGYAE